MVGMLFNKPDGVLKIEQVGDFRPVEGNLYSLTFP